MLTTAFTNSRVLLTHDIADRGHLQTASNDNQKISLQSIFIQMVVESWRQGLSEKDNIGLHQRRTVLVLVFRWWAAAAAIVQNAGADSGLAIPSLRGWHQLQAEGFDNRWFILSCGADLAVSHLLVKNFVPDLVSRDLMVAANAASSREWAYNTS